MPVIKFSVDWWNTLHQPATVIKSSGPSMDAEMLIPLLIMSIAFKLFYGVIFVYTVKIEYYKIKIYRKLLAD